MIFAEENNILADQINLVVIDPTIENYETLIAGVTSNSEILILEPQLDGIAQISDSLANYQEVASIQVFAHGSTGNLYLGQNSLNLDNINNYQTELTSWGQYLSNDADILLYGCNVAASDRGWQLLDSLSQLTGADVAASDDLTGNEFAGGDWQLERSTGTIEADFALQLDAVANFEGTLLAAGFQNELVLEGVSQPIALENLPDGRMIIAFRDGLIKTFDPSSAQPLLEDYLTVTNTYKAKETGLMDIKYDTEDGYLYTYYSSGATDRATISKWNMNVANPIEEIIWEDVSTLDGTVYHIGGSIDFGPDGKVWLTIGDKFRQSTSPNLSLHNGKIIRINKDGSIPDGTDGWAANPYAVDNDPTTLPDIWASGLRNPFRARWDLESGRFFIGDVGGNDNFGADASWEELNIATLEDVVGLEPGIGINYGWPEYEGPATANDPTPAANYKNPFFSWQHDEAGSAIIGGMVYRGTLFPEEYQGAYFFANYVDENIQYLTFDENGDVIGGDTFYNAANGGSGLGTGFIFDTDVGAVSEFEVGLDGALYYLDLSRRGDENGNGSVRRINYVGVGNTAPEITAFSASPTNGDAPLTVDFTAIATDNDGDTLTYKWDLDGDPTTGTAFAGIDGLWEDVTTTGNTSYTYGTVGTYFPTLFVSDGNLSDRSDDQFPTPIQVGAPPTVAITSPTTGPFNEFTFRAGEIIEFTAEATDQEDGTLTGTSLIWDVTIFHNDHNHPDPGAYTGSGPSIQVETSGHDYFGNVNLTVSVTATDSDGLSSTDSITIYPDESFTTFQSLVLETGTTLPGADNPIKLDGLPLVEEPFVYDNVIGFQNEIEAETEVVRNGARYQFVNWSDGVTDAVRTIFIPENDTTFTANYSLVNYLPDAVDDTYEIPADNGTISFDVLANDTDQDLLPLAISAIAQPDNGTVAIDNQGTADTSDDQITYTPNPNFEGIDTFSYTLVDNYGDTDTATVSVQVGDPLTITPIRNGLVLELDAGRGVTTSGGVVTGWNDQSGFGNDLVGFGDPELVANALNGQSIIKFDTTGDKLSKTLDISSSLPVEDSQRTVFMVTKYNENGYGGFAYGKTSQNNAFGLNVDAEGELMVQGWSSADMLTNTLGTGQGWLTHSAVVLANPSGASAELVNHYKDGVLIDSQERNFNTIPETLVVGSNLKGSNSLDMEVAEILVYDRALSEIERQQVENYLQQKYDIGSSTQTNQAPTATTDNFIVTQDSGSAPVGTTLDVLLNDTDLEGEPITLNSFTQPTNGEVVRDDNDTPADTTDDQLIYTPNEGFFGVDSFTYDISDSNGNTITGTVNITVQSDSTGTPTNTAPVASADTVTVDEDSTGNVIDVLVNDTDVDVDPNLGVMNFSDYEVLTASQASLRTVIFRELVTGGGLNAVPFVFDASPAGGDDPHFHMMGSRQEDYLTQHNSGGNGETLNFTFRREDGQAFAFTGFSYTNSIFYTDALAGEFTVIGTLPNGRTISQFFSPATIEFDPNTNEPIFQPVTLEGAGWRNIIAVNFVGSLSTTGTEPTQELNLDDLVIAEALPLTITSVATASNGTTAISTDGTSVVYTPNANFFGEDSFSYTVSDGLATDTATVNVTVNGIPNEPTAVPDNFTTDINVPLTFSAVDLLSNDEDLDGDILSVVEVSQPANGSLIDNSDGTYTYTPNADYTGIETLTYTVTDGTFTTTANLSIQVQKLTNSFFLSVDSDQTINGITVESQDIIEFDGTNYTMFFDGSDVGITGNNNVEGFDVISNTEILLSFNTTVELPNIGLVEDQDVVKFSATSLGTDTAGIFSLYFDGSLAGLNAGIDGLTQLADGSLLISTDAKTDIVGFEQVRDEDVVKFTPTTVGDYSSGTWSMFIDGGEPDVSLGSFSENIDAISVDGDGNVLLSTQGNFDVTTVSGGDEDIFIFTPTSSTTGIYSSTLFFDGSQNGIGGDISGFDLGINGTTSVSPSTTPPEALGDTVITAEDTAIAVAVLDNDTDNDGDILTLINATDGVNGSTIVNSDGTITYTPDANFFGNDSFVYTISDGVLTASATVDITVTATPDAPVAVDDSSSTEPDTAIAITVLSNDTDPDGDVLTVIGAVNGINGTTTINPDGTITYTPNSGFTGTDTFQYAIADGNGNESTAVVTVDVTAIPTAADSFYLSLAQDQELNGLATGKEDILEFDGIGYSIYFDGSNLDLDTQNANITGFDIISDTEILLVFNADMLLTASDSSSFTAFEGDIVKFTSTSLGENTTVGSFELFFDSSLAGLNAGIDGLTQLADGSLLISTDAKTDIVGFEQVRDEDVVKFTPITVGDYSSGTWSMFIDGGEPDVGLGSFSENIDAISVDEDGNVLLSTQGNFDVTTVSGGDEDIFIFLPTSPVTGIYDPTLFFDGSLFGLLGTSDISGFDRDKN